MNMSFFGYLVVIVGRSSLDMGICLVYIDLHPNPPSSPHTVKLITPGSMYRAEG